jgi:hypothetical protein
MFMDAFKFYFMVTFTKKTNITIGDRISELIVKSKLLLSEKSIQRLLIFFLLLFSSQVFAINYFVGSSNNDGNSGTNENSALETVEDQIGTEDIKTFLYHIQGRDIQSGDVATLAKFDNVVLQRFNYDDVGGKTYSAIKNINPNTKIFLYILGATNSDDHDSNSIGQLNCISRWINSRGHSKGNFSINNADLLLLDSNGKRIYIPTFEHDWLCDFGTQRYQDYWMEAVINDVINQAWKADGIFTDNCMSIILPYISAAPAKYSTNTTWTPAMIDFIDQISDRLSQKNQLLGVNYGSTSKPDGNTAWGLLDNTNNYPHFALEEGAFVSWYGLSPDANFFTKDQWKLQLNTLNDIKNYKTFFQSHTTLNPGESGTDNYGSNLTFWDAFWFAMTSFKLGQHDNSYFGFQHNTDKGNYSNFTYFDEFNINIGRATGDYQIKIVNGNEIFMREFEDAYVYVNPNNAHVTGIMLPGLGKQVSHDNFRSNLSSLPIINSIDLLPHRGTIIMKTVPDPLKPTIVNFSILGNITSLTVPVLTFNAVDNVGITGYLLTESATTPSVNDAGWKTTAPASYTFTSLGTKTLYAWVKNSSGKVSTSLSAQVVIQKALGYTEVYSGKTTNAFRYAMPVTVSETGEINSISIYHEEGGTGNLLLAIYSDQGGLPASRLGVTASAMVNSNAGWQTVSLTSPVKVSSGQKIWLSWVFQKNPGIRYTTGTPGRAASASYWEAGMPTAFGKSTISNTKYSIYCNYLTSTYLSDVTKPVITAFTIPSYSTSLLVPISSFTASDNKAVTGFKLTETSTAPLAGDAGWNGTAPSSYSFSSEGTKTLYAWVKDAAGNISTSVSDQVIIALSGSDNYSVGNTDVYSLVNAVSFRRAMPFTFSEDGDIQSISIYHNGGTGNMLVGVYANNSGKPGSLLGVTPSTAVNTKQGWQTVTLSSPVYAKSGQTVWLAWVFQNSVGVRFTTGSPGRAQSGASWSAGMPASFGTSTIGTNKFSIYCTYTKQIESPVITNNLGNTDVYSLVNAVSFRRSMPFTFGENGDIQSITIYHNGGTGNLLLGVYADNSGKPGSLLGVTPSTAVNTSKGWQTVTLSSPVSAKSGQTVWLAWVFQNSVGVRFTTGSPGRAQSGASWSAGMPASFGTSTIGTNKFSIYCTYKANTTLLKDATIPEIINDNSLQALSVENDIKSANNSSVEISVNSLEGNDFKLYPNPANSFVNVDYEFLPENGIIIEIIDINGRKVHSQTAQQTSNRLDINHLKSGLYIIRSTNGKRVDVKKLIVE